MPLIYITREAPERAESSHTYMRSNYSPKLGTEESPCVPHGGSATNLSTIFAR